MSEEPFFVVGYPRSGTTLLRFMLASHPRLFIPDETGFIPFLGVPADRPLSRHEVRRVTHRIAHLNREWQDVVAEPPALEGTLVEPRLGELIDALFRRRMRGTAAVRWGDKTPLYVLHIPTLAAIFPTARFIHLVRDGRDVAASAIAKWGRRFPQRLYLDGTYVLLRWAQAVRRGRAAARQVGGGRCLEIRYEDLVRNTEASLQCVCDVLGEELHPEMLAHERLARRVVADGGHVEVREPTSPARVGRWRAELSPQGAWTADRVLGPLLDELGYERPPVGRPSAASGTLLAVSLARYLAVRGAQRALEAVGRVPLSRDKRARRRRAG
jgi:hypothetical protein